MEINRNSLLAHYYMFMFNGKLPKDFCTLFWNTLIGTILLPIAITAAPFEKFWYNNLFLKTLFGALFWVVLLYLSAAGALLLNSIHWIDVKRMSVFLIIPLGLAASVLIISIVLATIIGIGTGIKIVVENIEERKYNKPHIEKQPSKLSIIWNTIRNKYCTKIDWKYRYK